ncbi:MAG TPA: hypothetical protein VIV11_06630 [Kofleriaceae bacterium]
MLIVSACSKTAPSENKPPADDKPAEPKATAVDAGPGAIRAPGPTTVVPTKPARPSLANRCVLGGDPLAGSCSAYNEGIAVGRDGLLYVVAGKQVRRYQRLEGADCRLEPSGEPIEMPADNPRPQEVGKGPIYMRSGGSEWRMLRAGDAIYAHDFLGGLFRIDRGKPEPVCDVFGYSMLAAFGKKLVIARQGFEELKLGKKCKEHKLGIDDKARGDVYAIRDHLYLANGKRLTRYDGKTPVELLEDKQVCYVSSLAACGDGLCVLDQNCVQIIQLGPDGKLLRKIDDDQLFATRPYGMNHIVAADNGNVYIRAKHRDSTNNKEICETAIYELPAAVFAH